MVTVFFFVDGVLCRFFQSVLFVLDSVHFNVSGMESPINRLSEG